MNGLIGRKIGMTSVFDQRGRNVACTVIDASSNVITQIKTEDSDGYNAVQLGFGEAKEKNTSQAMQGHFTKANTPIKQKLVEFRDSETFGKSTGESLNVEEVFREGDYVDVIGVSKGKGFQGVVKRHKFAGVGDATHGQHNRMRAPGSIGASSFPSKVFKGMKMGGRTGGKRVKMLNLEVVKIFPENNLLLIKGCIPGHKGGYVIIEK